MMATDNKIIVGLSGGVDSSVAAFLLLEKGYEVEALFMKNWDEDDDDEYCSASQDLADAQQVADQLGIKLHTVNFSHEYWEDVFEHFLSEHKKGRTPNPDVLCNQRIKFKAFWITQKISVQKKSQLVTTQGFQKRMASSY